mmetsp:Transcript_63153/g.148739  ORF Transcript_63153/g.148739 Transcript_63153/m.148739 type:complete len:123 (-) Transcript_63153:466-834(-)
MERRERVFIRGVDVGSEFEQLLDRIGVVEKCSAMQRSFTPTMRWTQTSVDVRALADEIRKRRGVASLSEREEGLSFICLLIIGVLRRVTGEILNGPFDRTRPFVVFSRKANAARPITSLPLS